MKHRRTFCPREQLPLSTEGANLTCPEQQLRDRQGIDFSICIRRERCSVMRMWGLLQWKDQWRHEKCGDKALPLLGHKCGRWHNAVRVSEIQSYTHTWWMPSSITQIQYLNLILLNLTKVQCIQLFLMELKNLELFLTNTRKTLASTCSYLTHHVVFFTKHKLSPRESLVLLLSTDTSLLQRS